MRCVAGLDLAAGRGVTALAALRLEDDGSVRYDAEEQCHLTTDEEILQALTRLRPRVLAVDAPLSLPHAVISALGLHVADTPTRGSPYTRAAERDPMWSILGVRPFPVSFLGGLTFRALVLASRLRAAHPDIVLVETFPTATFRAMGFTTNAPGERRPRKSSAEPRAALQRRLAESIFGVPPPDERLLDTDSLDAIGAAIAALAFDRGVYRAVGDVTEGQIILPGPAFRIARSSWSRNCTEIRENGANAGHSSLTDSASQ